MLFVKAAVGTDPGRPTGASQQSHEICHLASLAVICSSRDHTVAVGTLGLHCLIPGVQTCTRKEKDTVGRDTATCKTGAC